MWSCKWSIGECQYRDDYKEKEDAIYSSSNVGVYILFISEIKITLSIEL